MQSVSACVIFCSLAVFVPSVSAQSAVNKLDLICLGPQAHTPSGYVEIKRQTLPLERLESCPLSFRIAAPHGTQWNDKMMAAVASGAVTVTTHKFLVFSNEAKVEDIQKTLGVYLVPRETAVKVAPGIHTVIQSRRLRGAGVVGVLLSAAGAAYSLFASDGPIASDGAAAAASGAASASAGTRHVTGVVQLESRPGRDDTATLADMERVLHYMRAASQASPTK